MQRERRGCTRSTCGGRLRDAKVSRRTESRSREFRARKTQYSGGQFDRDGSPKSGRNNKNRGNDDGERDHGSSRLMINIISARHDEKGLEWK